MTPIGGRFDDYGGFRPIRRGHFVSVCLFVEKAIDGARHLVGNARHRAKIVDAGAGDRLGGAEMAEKRAFARGADAGNLARVATEQRSCNSRPWR